MRIKKNSDFREPSDDVIKEMEKFDYYRIVKLLKNSGLISKDTRKNAIDLLELRNTYSHARGDSSEEDCIKAIELLHKIIEETISIFKNYEIRNGKFIQK